ncbi:MAG: hypothetical protein C4308_00575 [Chitinophagaceae bacterium]
MRKITTILLFVFAFAASAFSQKKLSEGTVVYNVMVQSANPDPKVADGFDGATNTVYVKGRMSRSDLASVFGTQSTIIDGKTGNVTVLKEYGPKKFMIKMTQQDWKESNMNYDSVQFTYENDFKTIAGYKAQKAVGKLKNGETFIVYYTTELIPENSDFQYSNRNLPGLALQYESTIGDLKVIFTAVSVDFAPVPASKFDLPTKGFRVMTYAESKAKN